MDLHNVDNILILGNGFDLNCGLKSKFSDFFLQLDYNNRYDYFCKQRCYSLNGDDANIWFLLLYDEFFSQDDLTYDDIKWIDVEGFIKSVVCDVNKASNKTMAEKLQMLLNRAKIGDVDTSCYSIFLSYYHNGSTDIYDYLDKSLRKFEELFIDYLNNQIKQDKYKEKTQKLLDFLLSQSNSSTDLINFNYTSVPDIASLNYEHHIHGSLLQKNIIIGIDSSFLNNHQQGCELTKSFQKLIRKDSADYSLPDKQNIKSISFYGHSLGQQDFSYFLSIFHKYKIEDCNVELLFYYSEYKDTESDNKQLKKEYTSSIYRLINEYGKTIFGDSSSKNLLTMLLFANKIMVIKVPKLF